MNLQGNSAVDQNKAKKEAILLRQLRHSSIVKYIEAFTGKIQSFLLSNISMLYSIKIVPIHKFAICFEMIRLVLNDVVEYLTQSFTMYNSWFCSFFHCRNWFGEYSYGVLRWRRSSRNNLSAGSIRTTGRLLFR